MSEKLTYKTAKAIVDKGEPHAQFECDLYQKYAEAKAFLEGYEARRKEDDNELA